jgi:hypothetical protein
LIRILEPPKGAKLYTVNERKLEELWEKIRNYDQLFNDSIRWDEGLFFKRMLTRETVVLETETGILFLTDIDENLKAAAHVIFFDHRLSDKIELIRSCLEWAFLQFNLQRIETFIPEFARTLKRVMENKIGFKYEGRMRNRMFYKGNLCDVFIHSILKEEVL